MDAYYTISEKDKMVIYGGGALGKERYRYLCNHYQVLAFFDQNAGSISIEDIDIPIYTPQDGVKKLGTDIIVVVCIHNAYVHQEVAQYLYSLGVNKIVFLPMKDEYLSEPRMRMLRIYTYFCEHDLDKVREIPCYSSLLRQPYMDCIIRSNSEYIVGWCPIELLYTDKNWPGDNADIPAAAFRILAEGYEFFQGKIGEADSFIQVYMPEDGHSESVGDFLQRRFNTYLMLEKEWKENQEYFKYAPIEVKWNEGAYFNVLDGHNRICFLIDKGCRWIPVRMQRGDYELWLNEPVCKTVCEKSCKMNRHYAYHLPHPLFRYEKITKDDTCADILCKTFNFLSIKVRTINCILEISEYEGYFADNFLRMGVKQAIVLETNEEIIDKMNDIQQLIQIRHLQIVRNLGQMEGKVELAFLLKDMHEEDLEHILDADCMQSCKVLIHKAYGADKENQKMLRKHGYGEPHFLLRVVEENEVREVAVYSRMLN